MKIANQKITSLFLLFLVSVFTTKSQDIKANICEKSVLSDTEYEKCLSDTAWNSDILIKINYISFFKTEVLPSFRKERKKLIIHDSLLKLVKELKFTYDSVYMNRFMLYRKQMDKNQKFVQPKSYLSSVLSFEIFLFYPDINAVIINDPITRSIQADYDLFTEQYLRKCFHVYSLLNEETRNKIVVETSNLDKQKRAKKDFDLLFLFNDPISQELKTKLAIVNYLLWLE